MNAAFRSPVRYLITEGKAAKDNFKQKKREIVNSVRNAADRGIELVQIREKQLSAKLLYELASAAVDAAKGSQTKILINDRFDIAVAAKTDGVHLTGRSIPAAVVRKNTPNNFLIGVSTHSLAETVAAAKDGADFALFGPVFETPGKGDVVGIDKLAAICESVAPFPVIAVGGIDASNYRQILENGAAGFAAIRYLNDFLCS